jgi:transposase
MGKPYSKDLRERVVGAAQDGATIPETAEQFGLSISSVVRFRRLHRETGSVSPAKFGGYKGYALAAHEELVRQLVAEQPDITLAEIKAVLATEKVTVGRSSISRFLHHLKLRFKKKSTSRRARPAGRRRRTQGSAKAAAKARSKAACLHR